MPFVIDKFKSKSGASVNRFNSYNEIISTSKLPFHNPLVMKYYNVLAYFSFDYENCPFTKFSW